MTYLFFGRGLTPSSYKIVPKIVKKLSSGLHLSEIFVFNSEKTAMPTDSVIRVASLEQRLEY